MDADTLKFKRKVKVTDSYNILGIGYDSANDRYVIQTNADGGYQFKILIMSFRSQKIWEIWAVMQGMEIIRICA